MLTLTHLPLPKPTKEAGHGGYWYGTSGKKSQWQDQPSTCCYQHEPVTINTAATTVTSGSSRGCGGAGGCGSFIIIAAIIFVIDMSTTIQQQQLQ